MAEQYVKSSSIHLNAEEAFAFEYLKKNGFSVHKLLKNFIVEKAKQLKESLSNE